MSAAVFGLAPWLVPTAGTRMALLHSGYGRSLELEFPGALQTLSRRVN
jgi:hypothetical protein